MAKPLTGTKVLVILVAFFGVVIGVNVTMMKLAIATLPGTEVDSPYAAGLSYDREISAAQDQAARRWQVDAHIERRTDGGATLQVEARDASGQPADPLGVLARAVGPGQPSTVRVAAALTLSRLAERLKGKLHDDRVVEALSTATRADDPEIRQRAAYALGFFDRPEARLALHRVLNEEEDRTVRYNAAAALGRLGDLGALPVLREMLSPPDLAQVIKRPTPSETERQIEAIELEAVWALQAAFAAQRPQLALKLRPLLDDLSHSGPRNVRVETASLLKKLPASP